MTIEERIWELELLIIKAEGDSEDAKLFRDLVNTAPMVFYINRIKDEIRWLKYFKENEND